MKIELPNIRYHFPAEESDNPFNIESDKKFFIDASGFTFATNEISHFRDPYKNDAIIKNIPMGYKAIVVHEKTSIYFKGEQIKYFTPLSLKEVSANFYEPINKYIVQVLKPINSKTNYPKLLSPSDSSYFPDNMWNCLAEAVNTTKEHSRTTEMHYYITRILNWENWH